MLPDGWKLLSGKEVTSKITKGQSPKWQGFNYQEVGAAFITSENIQNGFLDISNVKFVPDEFSDKIRGSKIKKGDVLINIVGASIGRSCLYNIDLKNANINQAVCLFRVKSDVDNRFISFYFQSTMVDEYFSVGKAASARPNISLGDIRKLKIPLPPLPEQKKIAAVLSTWDEAIEGTERLLANSCQQKKALMQQLLTGKTRLPGFEGTWEIDHIRNISCIGKGKQLSKIEFIEEGSVPVINGGTSFSGKTNIFNCHKNTITISEGGNSCGYVDFQKEDFWCGGHCYYVERASINNNYLYYLLKYNERKIMSLRVGSGLPNIQKKDFINVRLLFPAERSEQKAIAAVLTTADDEIAALEKDLARLRAEKKALMQQLLTGKRRVKVA